MPDDTITRIPRNPNYIMLWDPVDVRFWCAKFGCTEERLKEAARAAGESATAVEEWLQKQEIARPAVHNQRGGWEL